MHEVVGHFQICPYGTQQVIPLQTLSSQTQRSITDGIVHTRRTLDELTVLVDVDCLGQVGLDGGHHVGREIGKQFTKNSTTLLK